MKLVRETVPRSVRHHTYRAWVTSETCRVSWAGFESGRVRLKRRAGEQTDYIELVGSPDLVVEIVSDSSVRKDTRLLREAYLRAGVREYWLIDARKADIRFDILRNDGDRWASSGDPSEPQASEVLGGQWRLTRAPNRVGRFTYTLAAVE